MKLLTLLLILTPILAQAVSEQEISTIQTDDDVKRMLRADSIDSISLDWPIISLDCKYITNKGTGPEFNQCKYRLAYKIATFRNNQATCLRDAETQVPRSMVGRVYEQHSQVTSNNPNAIIRYTYTYDDLRRDQTTIYRKCMREFGWNDPDDWKAGKK